MVSISTLRTLVNNGWTIANRKKIISQIGEGAFDEISQMAAKVGRNGKNVRYCDAKDFLQVNAVASTKDALTNTHIADCINRWCCLLQRFS